MWNWKPYYCNIHQPTKAKRRWLFKGAWPAKKNPSLYPHENRDFSIRRKIVFFLITIEKFQILGPIMFHLNVMNKKLVNFHKSVVTKSKVFTVFFVIVWYTFLWLIWKPLEPFCSKFGIKTVWTMGINVKQKTTHEKIWTCAFNTGQRNILLGRKCLIVC